MRFITVFLFIISVNCFGQNDKSLKQQSSITIKTFNSKETGWGYDILRDGKLYVHQPNIPAVSGKNGFKTEFDAKKTAALMKYKIDKNIIPPTIEITELDSLKINYK